MRASKKTYTKRSKGKGTKKRNYIKKTRRKRVRGGTDTDPFSTPSKKRQGDPPMPNTPIKEHWINTLRRRYLEELRRSGTGINGFNSQSKEQPYKRFEHEDFYMGDSYLKVPGEHPGYKHGFYDGENRNERIDFHYIPMTETVNDIVIDQTYRDEYRKGYDAGIITQADE